MRLGGSNIIQQGQKTLFQFSTQDHENDNLVVYVTHFFC